jgi:predicted phosphodiesterase
VALSILAVADAVSASLYEYFQPERWRHVDLILSAGDLPPEYLDFLCSSLNVPLLYVRGNHDGGFAEAQYAGSENVHGRIVTVKGIRVAGFEGSHWYNGGPCQYTERAMNRVVRHVQRQARRIGPPHIMLTHAPPAGCHDATDQCHQGFTCFREAMAHWKPSLFVHGHMHAYQGLPGVSTHGDTTVINAYPFRVIQVPIATPGPKAVTRATWLERARRVWSSSHHPAATR